MTSLNSAGCLVVCSRRRNLFDINKARRASLESIIIIAVVHFAIVAVNVHERDKYRQKVYVLRVVLRLRVRPGSTNNIAADIMEHDGFML